MDLAMWLHSVQSLRRTPHWALIFETAIRHFHNGCHDKNVHLEVWQVTGPAFERKLDFFSTLFEKTNGAVLLPEDLEPMSDEQEARIRGMRHAAPT
jgi:hypothetical protein